MKDTGKTIQIVKQVRLTPSQQLALMDMANSGRSKPRLDYAVQTVLLHLGLVEKRSRFTAEEKAKRAQAVKADWKLCRGLVLVKDLSGLDRQVDKMRAYLRDSEDTAFFLTPAAQEYLIQGTVTIKTGPTKKAAADAE